MKKLFSLILLPVCLLFCMHEYASAEDSKSSTRKSFVVFGQVNPIAIDSVNVSFLHTSKDLWDKALVVGTAFAAFFTGAAALATKKAAKATEKSIEKLSSQLDLQRMEALVKLSNFYQETHDRITKNMNEIMNAQKNVPPNMTKGFQSLYEKYFGPDALDNTTKNLIELRKKIDCIDKEIEKYYEKLV